MIEHTNRPVPVQVVARPPSRGGLPAAAATVTGGPAAGKTGKVQSAPAAPSHGPGK